jgi:isorenieratene synthase
MTSSWRPGRDARAIRHAPTSGPELATSRAELADSRPELANSRPEPVEGRLTPPTDTAYLGPDPVLVAGGGIAGIAAAVGLAERGVRVVLVEPHDQLGGRVRAWPVDHDASATSSGGPGAGRVTMSRGFHAFFRQYYNLRSLLRRVDPALDGLVPLDDYPLVLADGHTDSFAGVPRTPPVNLAAFVAQSPSFTLRDLAAVDVGAAMELLDVEFPGTFSAYDGESAAAFLDRLRFPDKARHLALEVFARSFFAHPTQFAAGELVAMFHSYFLGSSEGLLFDVPRDDYDTVFWAPLGRYLERRGVEVLTGDRVVSIDAAGSRVTLGSGTELAVSGVVVATDPGTTRELLLAAGLGDEGYRERVAALGTAPPFAVWRLWLDRTADQGRSAFLGTAGFGPLDNISLLERFEDGARRWSTAHGGSVVELHAYALVGEVDETTLKERMLTELYRVYPELTGARAVADEWLVQADCPLVGTGPWVDRLTVETPDPRVVLAGDGIRCDYPVALMERAATTGFLAANALLARRGLTGHDLWTVPMRSRNRISRPLHRLLAKV